MRSGPVQGRQETPMFARGRNFKTDNSSPLPTELSWFGWKDAALLASPVGFVFIVKALLIDAGIDAHHQRRANVTIDIAHH